jgi:hypothetical protein
MSDDIIDFLINAKEMYKKEAGRYPTTITMTSATKQRIRAAAVATGCNVFKDPKHFGDYILGMRIEVDDSVKDVQLTIDPSKEEC